MNSLNKTKKNKTVVSLGDFKFNSLRKYMTPVYSKLNLGIHESIDSKRLICRQAITEFFRRLREYRGITLQALAKQSKISISDLEAFELGGDENAFKEISNAYIRICAAHNEIDFFLQQIHEFQNPSIKESKIEIAMAALRQFGYMAPGIDYQNLNASTGRVISFQKRDL